MSDHNHSENTSHSTSAHSVGAGEAAQAVRAKGAGKRSRRRWIAGGLLAIAGLAGVGAVSAISQTGGIGHPGFTPAHFRSFSPAMMEARVDFASDLVLGRAGASPEQRKKVAAIVKDVLKDAPDFAKARMEAREKLIDLLKADKIDRAALERLRAEQIQAFDVASKKIVQALGDAGETLDAAQRRELLALMEKGRAMRRSGAFWR